MDFLEAIKTKLSEGKNHRKAIEAGYRPLDKQQYSKYNHFRPGGPKPVFCYLPYNSLTFSFTGIVHVCSYNRDVILGTYPENSIKEIWEGEKAQKLRRHMSHNDLEYGCRHCKFFFDKGKFSNIRPLVFDKYYKHTNADHPRVFEFELDNKCNLECQMCRGEVSSSIRKNRDKLPPIPSPYDDKFVEQLAEYLPTLKEAKFYGGEPFMIPIYYKIWDKIRELNPQLELFVITNGTLWNSSIERLVNDLNFDIAISIDAMDKTILEKIRKNVEKETLLENIHRFSEVCRRKNKYMSLSFTIQKDNWHQLPEHLKLCNSIDAYAYISYLENPVEFSILELPKDEIKKIREWMDRFDFSKNTPKEKHNAQCFEDYKHYLDSYLNNAEELRYQDYEFMPEPVEAGDREIFENDKRIIIKIEATREHFLNECEKYFNDNPHSKQYEINSLLQKLDSVLLEFSENDRKKIYGLMLKADIPITLNTLSDSTPDELKSFAKESLPLVVIEKQQ